LTKYRTPLPFLILSSNQDTTPVTEKYLCVVVKVLAGDLFIITAYFTDTIKKGIILWKKK
jgi:hypothetical protein